MFRDPESDHCETRTGKEEKQIQQCLIGYDTEVFIPRITWGNDTAVNDPINHHLIIANRRKPI